MAETKEAWTKTTVVLTQLTLVLITATLFVAALNGLQVDAKLDAICAAVECATQTQEGNEP